MSLSGLMPRLREPTREQRIVLKLHIAIVKEVIMLHTKCCGVFAATFTILVIGSVSSGVMAQTPASEASSPGSIESTQNEITRALSAAHPDVAQAATVAKMDSQGKIIKILRLDQTALPVCREIPRRLDSLRCVKTRRRCGGSVISYSTNPNRPTLSQASLTCWPELHSEVTPIHMTRQAHRSRLDPIG